MPDHIHLLHARDVHQGVGLALAAFAQGRNRRRGESGPVWQRQAPPNPVGGVTKLRRSIRYIHLNPCRAGLVTDPLAWPWSTHRDLVGLALPPVLPLRRDPQRFHSYVSSDPTVHVNGSLLPAGTHVGGLEDVVAAVSSLARVPAEVLTCRGPARSLLLHALRCVSGLDDQTLARELGLHRTTLSRVSDRWSPEVRTVARVVGDPRFEALQPWDLRRTPGWGRYRSRA